LPHAQPTSAAYSSVYLQETLARKVPAIHPDAGAALAIALGKTPARRFAHIGMFTRALASF
jgi:hypothetical protein